MTHDEATADALRQVETARARYEAALSDLQTAATNAITAGAAQRQTAAAAGVARQTLIGWIRSRTTEQPPLIGKGHPARTARAR